MDERTKRLRQAVDDSGYSQTKLCEITGITKGALSSYLSGRYFPKQQALDKLSEALKVPIFWLMGYDSEDDKISIDNIPNIYPIELKRFPLLGEIACGEPRFASEDRESYVEASTDIQADFCLKAKGDSMINARIQDGDIVFIREQPSVYNGEIAAVVIDDEATLKRVFYYPEKDLFILKAENPKYDDLVYSKSELDNIRILGKAIAFQSDVI